MAQPTPQQPPDRPYPNDQKPEPGTRVLQEPATRPTPEPLVPRDEQTPRREGIVSDPDHR